jgi:hypothetical protein
VLGYLGEDIDAATALVDQSLQINPSFADGWRWSGWFRLWAGLPDKAIDHFEGRHAHKLGNDRNGANFVVGSQRLECANERCRATIRSLLASSSSAQRR